MVVYYTWDLSLSGLAPPSALPTTTLILTVHSEFNFNHSNFLKQKHVLGESVTLHNEMLILVAARSKA